MTPARPTDISDFRLLTITCECRFPEAYRLWDRAGTIWSEIAAVRPGMAKVKVEPSWTTFRLGTKYQLSVRLDSLNVTAHNPGNTIEDFVDLAGQFERIVSGCLQIERYSRIGVRPIFVREYPDRDRASSDLLGMNLIRVPAGPRFGIPGGPVYPSYGLRWEDKNRGCAVRVSVEDREYDFDTPFAWEGVAAGKVTKTDLKVDVDYFTVASVTVGQVNLSEYINSAMHFIRKDIAELLGGR